MPQLFEEGSEPASNMYWPAANSQFRPDHSEDWLGSVCVFPCHALVPVLFPSQIVTIRVWFLCDSVTGIVKIRVQLPSDARKQPFARCKYVFCITLHALDIQHQWVTILGWNRTWRQLYSAQVRFKASKDPAQTWSVRMAHRFAQGAIPKDGPSAGVATTLALASLMLEMGLHGFPGCHKRVCFFSGPLQKGGGCFSCLLRPPKNGYPQKRHPYASCRVCDRLKITLAGSPCTQ